MIIFGNDLEQLFANAREIINLLYSKGLKCNANKCCFLTKRVYLLGHFVENNYLIPDHECLLKLTKIG